MSRISLEKLCGEYFTDSDGKVHWVKPYDENAHQQRKEKEIEARDFESIAIEKSRSQNLIWKLKKILTVDNPCPAIREALLTIEQWSKQP